MEPEPNKAEKVERVCRVIETTNKGVCRICKDEADNPDFPSEDAFYRWRNESEDLKERYARAKSDQSELLVDEMLEIADDKEREPNCRRVSIDTRKWIASKLKPKKFGDKLELDHKGGIKIVAVTSEDEQL